MGNLFSSNEEENNRKLDANAAHLYHMRVKAYNPDYHGPRYMYINWCRSQYELDRLPDFCKYGPNYTPKDENEYIYEEN